MIDRASAFCKKYFPSKLGEWTFSHKSPEGFFQMKKDLSDLNEDARVLFSKETDADGSMRVRGYLIVPRNPQRIKKGGMPFRDPRTDPNKRA